MRWIWAACLTFGLAACEDEPQPDVSAFTIMNLIVQTKGEPDVLPETLGALYEHVNPYVSSDGPGKRSITVSLGRDETPYMSQLSCTYSRLAAAKLKNEGSNLYSSAILRAYRKTLKDAEHRSVCQFDYTDTKERTEAFVDQAKLWATSYVGALTPDTFSRVNVALSATASDPNRVFSLFVLEDSTRPTVSVYFLIDLP